MNRLRSLTAFFILASMVAGPAVAQEPPAETPAVVEKPTPYDEQLTRLSEILGAVHYLRNLCNNQEEPEWRSTMQKLLDSETENEPGRRGRLTAAFNRGYRSFAAVHSECTPAAIAAEEQYRNEGATLATEIVARFGN